MFLSLIQTKASCVLMEKQKDYEVHLLRTPHRKPIALRTFSGNSWASNIGQRKTLRLVVSALW